MKVIDPLTITDAMLTSSTAIDTPPAAYASGTTYALNAPVSVAGAAGLYTLYKSLQDGNIGHAPATSPNWWAQCGTTYQVYNAGTTYALGDTVIDTTSGNHYIYESVVAGNLGNPLTDDTKWLEIGPTNRWAMFDLKRTTQTIDADVVSATDRELVVVITPGVRIDSLALLGMDAQSVSVKAHKPGYTNPSHSTIAGAAGTAYSALDPSLCYDSGTISLIKRETFNYYQYYFAGFKNNPSFAVFDIPPNTDNVITITLASKIGNVKCGACVIGLHQYIGDIQWQAESDALNFSTVTRNFDGGINAMVQRRSVPQTKQNLLLPKKYVNTVKVLRGALNGRPAVWCGLDDDSSNDYYEALLILGFYTRFLITINDAVEAVVNLELEEI